MVIAWRIMLMTLLGRESPELPPELLFTDVELKVLRRYAMKRKGKEIHTLRDAVTWTAILGGYQNRKHAPPPGADLTWYGRMKLAAMCEVVELYDLED
ncbi:MAG: IS4 family transposase [Gammaproteobacteria bacterium]|nr:IS4 family transposase [Gammaproteobacteria bacterium]